MGLTEGCPDNKLIGFRSVLMGLSEIERSRSPGQIESIWTIDIDVLPYFEKVGVKVNLIELCRGCEETQCVYLPHRGVYLG